MQGTFGGVQFLGFPQLRNLPYGPAQIETALAASHLTKTLAPNLLTQANGRMGTSL